MALLRALYQAPRNPYLPAAITCPYITCKNNSGIIVDTHNVNWWTTYLSHWDPSHWPQSKHSSPGSGKLGLAPTPMVKGSSKWAWEAQWKENGAPLPAEWCRLTIKTFGTVADSFKACNVIPFTYVNIQTAPDYFLRNSSGNLYKWDVNGILVLYDSKMHFIFEKKIIEW